MRAYRLGKYAFVLDSAGNLVVKAEFDDNYAAAKAVDHFNKGKHEIVPNW